MPRSPTVAALLIALLAAPAMAVEPAAPAPDVQAKAPPAAAEATPAPEPAASDVVTAPSPDLRPVIYVKDVDHLAELVKGDAAAGPLAARLATRRTAALVVFGAGAAVTVGCLAYAMSNPGRSNNPADPNFMKNTSANTAMGVGVGVGVISALVGLLVSPGRGELLDVVNTWNSRHPDQQFTVGDHQLSR
jgi:hypothetical protein